MAKAMPGSSKDPAPAAAEEAPPAAAEEGPPAVAEEVPPAAAEEAPEGPPPDAEGPINIDEVHGPDPGAVEVEAPPLEEEPPAPATPEELLVDPLPNVIDVTDSGLPSPGLFCNKSFISMFETFVMFVTVV
jgi:hypothetical protein